MKMELSIQRSEDARADVHLKCQDLKLVVGGQARAATFEHAMQIPF